MRELMISLMLTTIECVKDFSRRELSALRGFPSREFTPLDLIHPMDV